MPEILSQEDQEKYSEAIFMIAFETSLRHCREKGVNFDAIVTGMIRSMTNVIRMLLKDEED